MKVVKNIDNLDENVYIEKGSITYIQNPDCTENPDKCQSITLTSRNGGGGKFINIRTKGWSLDKPEDIMTLVNHFKNAIIDD